MFYDSPAVLAANASSVLTMAGTWQCDVQCSGIHITFGTEEDWKAAAACGWMSQMDVQARTTLHIACFTCPLRSARAANIHIRCLNHEFSSESHAKLT